MSALDDLRDHEEAAVKRALAELDKLRRQINLVLKSEDVSDFTMKRFRSLKTQIEGLIQDLEEKLTLSLLSDQRRAFDIGIKLADEPIAAIGIDLSRITGISQEAIRVSTVFSADLIQGLSSDIRSKVNGILRRAGLGSMTTQEAIGLIGKSLDGPGAFRSIAARAETIYRTEVLRIQAISTQLRQEANAKTVKSAGYVILKRWLATHDQRTRPSHLIAEGQIREIDEPFTVGGESLMFPRDPDGSAAETIQCRCVSESVVERAA